jgi:hypothetical protein
MSSYTELDRLVAKMEPLALDTIRKVLKIYDPHADPLKFYDDVREARKKFPSGQSEIQVAARLIDSRYKAPADLLPEIAVIGRRITDEEAVYLRSKRLPKWKTH